MESTSPPPKLIRRFGPLQATALNMSNMIGVGPFITIPLLMSAMGGPQALLGWFLALIVVISDGMVWSELGAAIPGSGGTYAYFREAFGRGLLGRLVTFLFVWQFIISGPLEIASGYIGFKQYANYLWPSAEVWQMSAIAIGVGILNVALLYRRITTIAAITVSLWVGTLLTTAVVIVTGVFEFDASIAFDFPPNAFQLSWGFVLGLASASRIGIYDYLGYYDICYIGEEVRDPGRTIPRSILVSVLVVAAIYIGINLSVIGVVPWRECLVGESGVPPPIVSIFMEKVFGPTVATVFTLMILWTAFGSVFALLLGYSRIPYAAAQDGFFFKAFGRLHPTKAFPHVSLVVLGGIAIVCTFFSLDDVIAALLVTRILVQFMGQVAALVILRRTRPDLPRPYRMWLYPLPAVLALVGWTFLFATAGMVLWFALATLYVGVAVFFAWQAATRKAAGLGSKA